MRPPLECTPNRGASPPGCYRNRAAPYTTVQPLARPTSQAHQSGTPIVVKSSMVIVAGVIADLTTQSFNATVRSSQYFCFARRRHPRLVIVTGDCERRP